MATHFTPTKGNTHMTNKNTYLSMRDMHMNAGTTKMYRLAQSGRSMVEMLGVLAIVGVLSIGGIMGYDYAVAKFRANTIMSELNLRAVPISQQLTQHLEEANTALTLEAGDTLSSGQSVSANVAINPEYFEFHLTEVDDTTCELVLENYETPAWMMVNGNLYENSTDICSNPDNDMTFVYKNDLGERRNCSSKGFFNLETYKCDCAGGTYFNKDSKDCACPAGHIWSEAELKCIESRCEEGEFEVPSVGCVSCEDPNGYRIFLSDANAQALCQACGHRYIDGERCIPNICTEGTFPAWDGTSLFHCLPCSSSSKYVLSFAHDISKEQCNACPNRHYVFFGVHGTSRCILNSSCDEGYFYGATSCYSCDTPNSIVIGTTKNPYEYEKNDCLSCKKDGISIRSVVIGKDNETVYCQKIICSDTEFMGADGRCYPCSTEKNIEITGDNSGCEKTTCNRISKTVTDETGNTKTMCQIKSCDGILLEDGSCYPCDTQSVFKTTKEICDSCGLKEDGEPIRGYLSNGYCRLNNCILGESFPYNTDGGSPTLCYPCTGSGDGTGFSGFSSYAKRYCEEGCGNYVTDDGYCYTKTSCNRGSEFRAKPSNYRFCTSCDYTDKVEMAGHEEHNKMCTSCVTTPRFFADNYCYRCDSSETPIVSTAEERDSCIKCPNRTINSDNQCILLQTEE